MLTAASTASARQPASQLLYFFVFSLSCQCSQVTAKRGARFWLPSVFCLVCAAPLNESFAWVLWPLQVLLHSSRQLAVVVEVVTVKGVSQGFWATTASSRPVLHRSVLTGPFFETLPPHQTLLLMGLPTLSKGPYRNAQCRVFFAPCSWGG